MDAVHVWDDSWVCCPSCGGWGIVDEETGEIVIHHDDNVAMTEH